MNILHVPYHFEPLKLGGTEIYVVSLIHELKKLGVNSQIAAPSERSETYYTGEYEKIKIHYFGIDQQKKIEYAYGYVDEVATTNFIHLIDKVIPDIVHFHAKSSAVNSKMIQYLNSKGIRTFFTYHTPTVTCPRGNMLLYGKKPCNGLMNLNRCTGCVLQKHGIPEPFAKWLGKAPISLLNKLKNDSNTRVNIFLKIKGLIQSGQEEVKVLLNEVDQIVAVCNWVNDVLLKNDINPQKIYLSRQGLPNTSFIKKTKGKDFFLIKYFGRIDETKGILELIQGFKYLKEENLRLEIYGIIQDEKSDYLKRIIELIETEPRIALKNPVAPQLVQYEMSEADVIAVPSKCLETGPLVVLEAFQMGIPVIASDLGGNAELIQNQIDGILVKNHTQKNWTKALNQIVEGSNAQKLAENIKPVRKSAQVAEDMKLLYEQK